MKKMYPASFMKSNFEPDIVVNAFDPSTLEAELGGSL